jgi:hypothetical protein
MGQNFAGRTGRAILTIIVDDANAHLRQGPTD